MSVIGISGRATAGKDAIAARLVERWGFTRVSLADALREEVMTRLPRTLRVIHDMVCGGHNSDDCIRRMLYEVKPRGFRELLQEYGSDVRRHDQPDYWVERWWERSLNVDRVVVPDVRFENEAKAVLARGGLLWRVERPGTSEGDHASETMMDGWSRWDAVIRNDGTLADLYERVDGLAAQARERAA